MLEGRRLGELVVHHVSPEWDVTGEGGPVWLIGRVTGEGVVRNVSDLRRRRRMHQKMIVTRIARAATPAITAPAITLELGRCVDA